MELIRRALDQGRTVLSELESKQVLAHYGIPVTREILVRSGDRAAEAADKIGYPLVLKGCSPEVAHKTEKGLIETDIRTREEAAKAYARIISRSPGLESVLVQEIVKGKRELVVGMTRDPQFGPSVMFGLGGIFTEVLRDVVFRVAPLEKADCLEMMNDIKGRKILDRVRGMEPAARDALAEILIQVGRIGLENEAVKEIDINPVILDGARPVAVDALIILDKGVKAAGRGMSVNDEVISGLDSLFNPDSTALVGLPQGMKTGKLFLVAMRDMGYAGKLYGVNPKASEIDGVPCYQTVSDVPGPIDLAIVLVPTGMLWDVARECADKGVKGAVLFTAGGKELGTEEGRLLEADLAGLAASSGMRIFGPNCMGLYSSESGISFFPGLSKKPGPVGLISHSGSLANIIGRMHEETGITFSKMASLGNECDVNASHMLAYLGRDDRTRVIGMYIENIKDGRLFLDALKSTSLKKPVLLWKQGLTREGGRAASSHTGALAGSREIWEGMVRQGGGIPVFGWEEWVDSLMTFSMLPGGDLGNRLAIISGPGGLCVSMAEACGRAGLALAELNEDTQAALARFIPPTGTSLRNPVDVSLTASMVIDMYIDAARIVTADPGVDALMIAGIGLSPEDNRKYTAGMIDVQREAGKPFLMVDIPGLDPAHALEFRAAGIPFYMSGERAAEAYAKVIRYRAWRVNHTS